MVERLGFASQSYFSKSFKRETGFTPINFAKQEKLSKTKYPDYNK
ncbi:helix-turn-helix domain-containing protein [Thomasclavelia spiroformis]